MLKELIKLSNELDQRGLTKEADALDKIIKEAQEDLPSVVEIEKEKTRNRNKLYFEKKLNETANWFNANVFISTPNQWPIFADQNLFIHLSGDNGIERQEALHWDTESFIAEEIEMGTEFTSFVLNGEWCPRMEDPSPDECRETPSLHQYYGTLLFFVEMHNLNVPNLHEI